MTAPPIETWRTVPSYPAYSASSLGRVRRDAVVHGGGGSTRHPSGVLRQRALPLGHRQVTLSMHNKPTTVLVHRIVAEAFLPAPQPGQDCVCHRDDDPSNNRPENLFWGTRADNMRDMVAKGRQCRGERVASAKLSQEAVEAIRRRLSNGERQRAVAAIHGVAQSTVSLIATGAIWGHSA